MYLRAGESYTVYELLTGLLLASGNDAALTAAAAREVAAQRRALLPLCAHDFLQSARLLGELTVLLRSACADDGPADEGGEA